MESPFGGSWHARRVEGDTGLQPYSCGGTEWTDSLSTQSWGKQSLLRGCCPHEQSIQTNLF